jgi:succinate dehydrogenase / fumarate reductase membrane anchor subunit
MSQKGTSHKGTPDFIVQRASAALLAPLGVWFLISLVGIVGADFGAARAFLTAPLTAIPFAALIIVGAVHMRIGMSEIIRDYFQGSGRSILLTLNTLAALALVGAALWSLFTLNF